MKATAFMRCFFVRSMYIECREVFLYFLNVK